VDSARTKKAVVVTALTILCRCALALNPSQDISQYAHTAWTIREGVFKSIILSITQTSDGYLWLGTESGLLRFDGVRAVPWTPPGAEELSAAAIYGLLGTRDGALWIGTTHGLMSWNGAKLTKYPELNPYRVSALLEDREGTVWAGGWAVPNGALCEIRSGAARCYGQDGTLRQGVLSIYEDTTGHLWTATSSGLWRWKSGVAEQSFSMTQNVPFTMAGLSEAAEGQVVVSGRTGLVNTKAESYPIPGRAKPFVPERLLRDRNGALWIGTTDSGLLHVHGAKTDVFSRSDGLSAQQIVSLFEDREGDIWVSTIAGLERFRELAIPSMSAGQGLSGSVFSLLAGRDGSVWMGGTAGLSRWNAGHVSAFTNANVSTGGVQSLFQGDSGRIWFSTRGGLVSYENGRFTPQLPIPGGQGFAFANGGRGDFWVTGQGALMHVVNGRVVDEIPWSQLGVKETAISMISGAEPGDLWLGFRLDNRVIYFRDGKIRRSYTVADGLGAGAVYGLKLDRDGALWAATTSGLSLIRNGHVTTFTTKNGLPCNTMHLVMDDAEGSTWLYTGCGLLRLDKSELDALKTDAKRIVHPVLFDNADGVLIRSLLIGGYGPRFTKLPDGKIWFLPGDGNVSVIDPRHLPVNKVPPPVHIESIIADDKPYDLKPGMRLPANVRNLRIEYTALSLVAPEKIHFKYKLEGQNKNWHEVINERQATYTNLGPRNYRFRVIASNNSGVWNETGDTLEFSVAPAYYQTTWFYASCVAAFLFMLWGLYRLRLHQIAREFNAQLDGRVDERLRVARELHDTMLQSFQAALIQMQAARNIFARRPEKTEESLDKAIETAAGAIAEGRSAIQDLRLHPAGGGDLAELLTTASKDMARSEEAPENPPVFGLTVEGERRDLAPLIQDEVYRIARELLRNAFRHSQAERIEVEIRYESRQLRLHVRDDGRGIEPEILKAGGRAGHYGFPGMRERASRFGGKLEFWSEAGAGTEAVLTVPGAVAYGASNGGRFSFLRRKKAGA